MFLHTRDEFRKTKLGWIPRERRLLYDRGLLYDTPTRAAQLGARCRTRFASKLYLSNFT